jgi:valyl-tRNA synthetase
LLEIAKPAYREPVDEVTYNAVIRIFEENLKLLHPFMPFLTEEVWQHMSERTEDSALIVSPWPEKKPFDPTLLKGFEFTKEVISGIRTIRKEKSIPFREAVALYVLDEEGVDRNWDVLVRKLANTSGITYSSEPPEGALSFRVKSNEYFVPLSGAVDMEAEIRKIEEELDYTRGFLASVQKKLSNQRFVENAPQQVVDMERKKAADAESKIETLEKSLANYK